MAHPAREKMIIPVASGKGGVGKSMLVANLGIALARLGYSTTVVDLDLGGSNLHTCLGIPNRHPGVGDFMKGERSPGSLSSYRLQTPWPNLQFVPGDGRTPFMANIPPRQRKKLLDEVGRLPGDIILLDLGAGSALNTLGFFGMVPNALLLTTFETPAIMNLLSFLKNFSFWAMGTVAQHDEAIYQMLQSSFRATMEMTPVTVDHILRKIDQMNPATAQQINEKLHHYVPRIVFNMGERVDDLKVTDKISQAMQHGLSMNPEYFGYIRYDQQVRRSMVQEKPLQQIAPASPAMIDIEQLAQRMVRYWGSRIPDSAAMLTRSVRKSIHDK